MRDVAKLDIPFVQAFKDRHGRMRYYFRRKGCRRVALPSTPGSRAFADAYRLAVAAGKLGPAPNIEGPRSVGALMEEYYRSAEFLKNLKPSTRKSHKAVLEAFRKDYGRDQADELTPKHLNQIFHKMSATPAQASNLRKRLRSLFDLADALDWIPEGSNPATLSRRVKYKTCGFEAWTDDDIAAFEAKWPPGSRERLALYLLLYTGQRRSDVVTMGRQHIAADRISVVQAKTGKRLRIRLHPALKAEIDLAPKGMTLLLTQYDKPFSAAGFTGWFVAKAGKAGLSSRSPHGLRKAAGRRLAEAGCSAKEIAAVLGHESLAMVELYTRDANQEGLADAGIDRLSAPKTGTECQTGVVKPKRKA